MAEIFVFIDFDDTLIDQIELRSQYIAAVGQLLRQDYGVDGKQMEPVVDRALSESHNRYVELFEKEPLAPFNTWLEKERARIVETVFEDGGIAMPSGVPPSELAKRLQFDALIQTNAALQGAMECLQSLFEAGARTQIASAWDSDYLLAALMGAGLESYTESKFGPDLVDCAKESVEYYRRIFDAVGCRAEESVVVDDSPAALDWAEEAGARVVQALTSPRAGDPEFPTVIRKLAELPQIIK